MNFGIAEKSSGMLARTDILPSVKACQFIVSNLKREIGREVQNAAWRQHPAALRQQNGMVVSVYRKLHPFF